MTAARRRGLLLLCFALVCGGLAASQVREREHRAQAAVGPLVPVVVAQHELAPDERLNHRDLAIRRVPARFAPPDGLAEPEPLVGIRTAVGVPAGAYVTATTIQGSGRSAESGALRPGQRAVELAVAGGTALAGAQPGAHVDVLVSAERSDGAGRTFVALENVELIGVRAGGGEAVAEAEATSGPTALATLRVGARQAVYLTAATNFARELRLLIRPPGDRTRVGPLAVEEGGL